MIYKSSLALLTDLYELTMAYGYWKLGMMDREAVFTLFFRKRPFGGNYALAAGLETAIEFIKNFRFEKSDLDYLESLTSPNGEPLFEKGFLDYLSTFTFNCDIFAMPEGTPVFPYEPLILVRGPILQAQLLESALLNIVNFQTLIATKAARICASAEEDEVIEFGLRRAQGIDGAFSGTRATFVGGCQSTSNVIAGKYFGIPVKGTHAHSWIMAFDREEEAFDAYTDVLPDNCIYLVDTYDTVEGVKKAIKVAQKKKTKMLGVRLDSGDLAQLSIKIRKLLDDAGFEDAKIMASNELDELIIRDLKQQGAKINVWGVGTNLITATDQPALDGVYKLAAIQNEKGEWVYKLKISEQLVKTTNPGILQVRRFYDREKKALCDMLYDMEMGCEKNLELIDPLDPTRRKQIDSGEGRDLLIPIFKRGKQVYTSPSLQEIQANTKKELETLDPHYRRFLNPHIYFVGLEKGVYDLKMRLIDDIKGHP
ncbi:nicotinate phosphoribosyltransferase [Candidatus Neptunochlamydia vexilliferae]|uniref:Nicotinate phosphoribosyltransferase n=1 Tax=Candidatus Neptunichlamydia vexilliferae TaxID=1651774 RepID=A0ABS0AYS4_9BACT|nr:nicotinate phosphoribosyltransferase [Candidatus Neptunochlamydia vexilliferae]MBF5058762.1 Nicotinate phosphoribosyltransferase [Candidatus Neptunochlamydia vexilliferae]